MGTTYKIVSIILKNVANGKISNELIKDIAGSFIDKGVDISTDEIEKFIEKRKTQIENILSRENMINLGVSEDNINFVVCEIKDLFLKVEVTDDLFRESKYDRNRLGETLYRRYRELNSNKIECIGDIRTGLYNVGKELDKAFKESEKFEKKLLIQINNTVDDIYLQGRTNHQEIMERFNQIDKDFPNRNIGQSEQGRFKNNRKSEYIDIWNSNLFLHSKESPKTLSQAFVTPNHDSNFKITELV